MENRERHILDAATRVFLRYGVKRASMGDIAAEAGVARQTLYNFYANKDDILRGSIRMFGEDAMARLAAEMPNAMSVADKLDLVLREMVVKPFIFLHSSPNAQDLIDGYNAAGRSEMEANYESFQSVFRSVFQPHESGLSARGLEPEVLAELVRHSASALKYQARDEAQLTVLIAALKAMIVAVIERG